MKSVLSTLAVVAAVLFHPAAADWQYRSRPDLAPPRLNITIPATSDVEPGYLFLAPFAGFPDTPTAQYGPRQAGPYIFKDNGDLVWSGYAIYSIWSTNFQAGQWKGKDVLFSFEGDHNAGYGHGHGHITIMDQHYETIRELRGGNHKLIDKHEFHIANDSGLVQIYQPVPRDLTEWGAIPEQRWIVNAIIQGIFQSILLMDGYTHPTLDLDIATGELLFEWSSLDHVSPDGKTPPKSLETMTKVSLQRLFSLSTLVKPALDTILLMLGITSTSTVLTRIPRVTTLCLLEMPVPFTKSTALMVLLFGG